MNTQSTKRHQSANYVETKHNNGGSEVFVLPPDLLEKLGIKLDNIVSNEIHPVDPVHTTDLDDKTSLKKHPDVYEYFKTPKAVTKKNESSILETASLMKESVFLSPTFVPATANVISGELEFVRSVDTEKSEQKEIESSSNFPGHISPKQNSIATNDVNIKQLTKNKVNGNTKDEYVAKVNNCDIGYSATLNERNKNNNVTEHSHLCLSSVPKNGSLVIKQDPPSRRNRIQVTKEEVVNVSKSAPRHKSTLPYLNNILTPVSVDMLLPPVKNNQNTLGSIREGKNIVTEKVDNFHDIGRTETDVIKSEKIHDSVVNDVVKHVDVLYVNDTFVNSVTKPSLTGVFSKPDDNIEVGGGYSTLNSAYYDNKNNLDVKVNNIRTTNDSNFITKEILEKDNPQNESEHKTDANMPNVNHNEVVIDMIENVDFAIPKSEVGQCESETHDKVGLCSEECSSDYDVKSCSKFLYNNECADTECMSKESYFEINEGGKTITFFIDKNYNDMYSEDECVTEQVYTEKNNDSILTLSYKNNEKEINITNSELGKSKLCIQGVEKPGGMGIRDYPENFKVYGNRNKGISTKERQSMNDLPESSNSADEKVKNMKKKVLKTYTRDKKNVKKKNPDIFVKFSNDLDGKNECETTCIGLDVVSKTNDFCLCGDFGQLKYYDYDSMYEHIHFWKHNAVSSDCELIFGMYNVETVCDYKDTNVSVSNFIEVENETLEEFPDKICWNEINEHISYDSKIEGCFEKNGSNRNKKNVTGASQLVSVTTEIKSETNCIHKVNEIVAHNAELNRLQNQESSEDNSAENCENKEKCDIMFNTCTAITEIDNKANLEDITAAESNSTADQNIPDSNMDPKRFTKKRKASIVTNEDLQSSPNLGETKCKKDVKCGVCNNLLATGEWEEHSSQAHGHIAWKAGETFDFKDYNLKAKIKNKLKKDGVLKCTFCSIEIKLHKRFLLHVEDCSKRSQSKCDSKIHTRRSSSIRQSIGDSISSDFVNCGVCKQNVKSSDWFIHICEKHNYLAWKNGETPLDLNDATIVENHLCDIIQIHGAIICSKCGFDHKYGKKRVKLFLEHIKICDNSANTSIKREPKDNVDMKTRRDVSTCDVRCGVCDKEVLNSAWIDHIGKEHDYLAWKDGENALDLDDEEEIKNHLYVISKKYDGLICSKCGAKRKYVKKFLSHINECDGTKEKEPCDVVPVKVEHDVSTYVGGDVKCGVCEKEVPEMTWINHIGTEHDYLAWKNGERALNLSDDEEVKQHLYDINKKYNGLICSKCGVKRKYVKSFLSHIKECDGTNTGNESLMFNSMNQSGLSEIDISRSDTDSKEDRRKRKVKCGVCSEYVFVREWFSHIGVQHNYIAWKDGEKPMELEKDMVEDHLMNILNEFGRLCCSKCGLAHASGDTDAVKGYLTHIEICDKEAEKTEYSPSKSNTSKVVKCGVCGIEIERKRWIQHIEAEHDYLAWIDGEDPLELDDPECIRLHLFTLIHQVEAFTCSRCGTKKKYPKSFITHLDNCVSNTNFSHGKNSSNPDGTCQCAVCSETVPIKKWTEHAMENHYNIAWRVGDEPIDLKSNYGTDKYLKAYKQKKGKLICKNCGISRVSLAGFYAHILACGKTEEELEEYQNICEICNNKYICIYKNQHMQAHKEQENAKERKLRANEMDETSQPEQYVPPGRRKAAVKANNVIEQFNSTNEFKHTCATCGFDTDCERKMERHKCGATFARDSDSDSETEESEDTDVSKADYSAEEEVKDNAKKKKNKESTVQARTPDVPFKYNQFKSYIAQNKEDFYNLHYTDDKLFPHWSVREYEVLSEEQIDDYLPKLEKSCQVNFNKQWTNFERFQVKESTKGCILFVGASVQCLSWIPPRKDDDESASYLSVSCHQGSDCPRYNFDDLDSFPGLIQIWDFGTFRMNVPKLVMGLAHDYGTIWAMDWCPSGTRDDPNVDDIKHPRLGLLAIACSNGLVYILSVPHPSTIADRGKYLKLKPMAELRMSTGPNRRLYQATAISWSKHKGHALIAVGYSDGSTALYDLNNTSPLLQCTENGTAVFYPYHDEREHNICVTDMDTFAGSDALCSASLGGVATLLRPGATMARMVGHTSTTGCKFAPGWPSILLAVEEAIGGQGSNELDWYGCGRRLGPMRLSCGCMRCGRVLMYAPPMLRTIQALPPYTEIKKQNIFGIRAQSLTKKRARCNDELAMKLEPLSYDEAIAKYGIEVFFVDANDKGNSINTVKEQWTERFPLADVTAMAFCPAQAHHHKAVAGVHAGFVVLFTL